MEKELEQTKKAIIKVVFFGPESTGKTTLAKALAEHYKTEWVPEYMRLYLQDKWNTYQTICTEADMLPIAKGQMQIENKKAKTANQILFCDTNLLQNWVYANVYFENFENALLKKYVEKHFYDLYILCNIDVPWQADDLRDKPNEREKMYGVFKNELILRNLPYLEVKGNLKHRMQQCISAIDLLKK